MKVSVGDSSPVAGQAAQEAIGPKRGRNTDPKAAMTKLPRRKKVPDFLKARYLRCRWLRHALSCRFLLRNNGCVFEGVVGGTSF
jgi:hypothetical protein